MYHESAMLLAAASGTKVAISFVVRIVVVLLVAGVGGYLVRRGRKSKAQKK
jgi:hypothetical protein